MSMACSSITLLLLTLHPLGVCSHPSVMCRAIPADACTLHQLPARVFCGLWVAAFPCPLLPFMSVLCCLSCLASVALCRFPAACTAVGSRLQTLTLLALLTLCWDVNLILHPSLCVAVLMISGLYITATATADISLSLLHLRTSLLSQHTLVDISRCALTTIHYPEQRTLTADEPATEPLPATTQHLAATAEALLTGGGHRWPTSTAAVQGCDISASSGGQHQSAADPTAAVRDPSSHQAESCSHMTGGFSHPGVMAQQGQQSQEDVVPAAVRHHAAGYDPVWMLLWAVKVTTC